MSKPKDIHLHAPQPKVKFAFDESSPLKSGYLNKQGEKLKTLKKRFFVLYPNFLIVYTEIEEWQYDQSVGGLKSRKGVMKLTGAKVVAASSEDSIGHCKYPFVLNCPDVNNKRKTFVLDATSPDERNSWAELINQASQPKTK